MTIPRKGRRQIRVGETDFAWRIRKKPTYGQAALEWPMTIAVSAHGEGARSVLVVNVRISRPDNWIRPHQTSVTPKLVRLVIESALGNGWKPFSTGPFVHEYALSCERL